MGNLLIKSMDLLAVEKFDSNKNGQTERNTVTLCEI